MLSRPSTCPRQSQQALSVKPVTLLPLPDTRETGPRPATAATTPLSRGHLRAGFSPEYLSAVHSEAPQVSDIPGLRLDACLLCNFV